MRPALENRLALNGSAIQTVGVRVVQHWDRVPDKELLHHKLAAVDIKDLHGIRCRRCVRTAVWAIQVTKAPGLIRLSKGNFIPSGIMLKNENLPKAIHLAEVFLIVKTVYDPIT